MGWRKYKHFRHLLHAFCQGAGSSSSLPSLVIGRELKEVWPHSLQVSRRRLGLQSDWPKLRTKVCWYLLAAVSSSPSLLLFPLLILELPGHSCPCRWLGVGQFSFPHRWVKALCGWWGEREVGGHTQSCVYYMFWNNFWSYRYCMFGTRSELWLDSCYRNRTRWHWVLYIIAFQFWK